MINRETYHVAPATTVEIAPDFGCNLLSWTVDGQQLLYFPEVFSQDKDPFFMGGNPVLFPSVGRTWDRTGDKPIANRYRIHGRSETHEMPTHGLGLLGRWTKQKEDVSEQCVHVRYQLSTPEKVRARQYPFEVALSVGYRISPNTIQMDVTIHNCGHEPAPFAFGFHPYFRISRKQDVTIGLPCTRHVVLDPELLIPVGEQPLTEPVFPLEEDKRYNDVFTGVCGPCAAITDTKRESEIKIHVDDMIEAFVVSTRPGTSYICVEPWTRGLGMYERLAEAGWEHAGHLNVVMPGQERATSIAYSFDQNIKPKR